MYDWGSVLLRVSEGKKVFWLFWAPSILECFKARTSLTADVVLGWLGYWTDNGGAYWYHTEPGKNYQEVQFLLKPDCPCTAPLTRFMLLLRVKTDHLGS